MPKDMFISTINDLNLYTRLDWVLVAENLRFHEKWSRAVTQKLPSRTEIRNTSLNTNNTWNIHLSHTGKDRRLLKEIFLKEFAGRYQVRPPCYFTINWAHNASALNASKRMNGHVWKHILSFPSLRPSNLDSNRKLIGTESITIKFRTCEKISKPQLIGHVRYI